MLWHSSSNDLRAKTVRTELYKKLPSQEVEYIRSRNVFYFIFQRPLDAFGKLKSISAFMYN